MSKIEEIMKGLIEEKGDVFSDQDKCFCEHIFKCMQMYVNKQKDYTDLNILLPGIRGLATRLQDKISRIDNLAENMDRNPSVTDERLEDSFADLFNYGIIGLILLEGRWGLKGLKKLIKNSRIDISKLLEPGHKIVKIEPVLQKSTNTINVTSTGINLAFIPRGKFLRKYEGGEQEVTISKDFLMGVYPITQEEYERVTGETPSEFKGNNKPVETVSWWDSIRFCNALSVKEGLTSCYDESSGNCDFSVSGYRLSTEAEWEYACRAGTSTLYYWGDDLDKSMIKDYAWYIGSNSPSGTKDVGQKIPNAFGLYDMSGNVWEWCNDWFQDNYLKEDVIDPQGAESGSGRVFRGGHWNNPAIYCRSAYRYGVTPSDRYDHIGFRVCRNIIQVED